MDLDAVLMSEQELGSSSGGSPDHWPVPVGPPVPDATSLRGTPGVVRKCSRCGHESGHACPGCGREDVILGGMIGNDWYCHAFSPSPSCYDLETRGRILGRPLGGRPMAPWE